MNNISDISIVIVIVVAIAFLTVIVIRKKIKKCEYLLIDSLSSCRLCTKFYSPISYYM